VIGQLEELQADSISPSCAYSFFISQNWEGGQPGHLVRKRQHPDNKLNTKLKWLKRIKNHMRLPQSREIWIWLDLISIPQQSRELQLKAITSLCAYTQLCTRCGILVFVPRDLNRF